MKRKIYFVLLNAIGAQSSNDNIWVNFREQDLHRDVFIFNFQRFRPFRTHDEQHDKVIFLEGSDMDPTLTIQMVLTRQMHRKHSKLLKSITTQMLHPEIKAS